MTAEPGGSDQTSQDEPVPAVDASAEPALDLLAIGLLVFFVALLLIVAALLVLPMIYT
jgi:hypothetical protein